MAWFRRSPPALVDGEPLKATGKVVAIGELHTAPLSHKACVHWRTTVTVPVGSNDRVPSIAGLRALAIDGPGGLITLPFAGKKGPMQAFRRDTGSVFAVELDGARVVVDSAGADVDGPPEVMIPRELERERKLLDDWGLTGTYRTGRQDPEPIFEEIVLAVGDRVTITGTLQITDVSRLTGTVTLRKRR
jgi:hypothetical protein